MLEVEKKRVKSDDQNSMRLAAITLGSIALVLVAILSLCVWMTGCRVYVVKDGNKVQIRAGSRNNKGNSFKATEQINDEVKEDYNVTLSRHSTEITVVKSEDSLSQRGEDHDCVDARLSGNENVVHSTFSHQERTKHLHDGTQHMHSRYNYNSPAGLYDYSSHLHLYAPRYSANLYHGQHRSVPCPHHSPASTDSLKWRDQVFSAHDIALGPPVQALTNLKEEK